MYIGNTPNNQAYTPAVDFFSGNASTTVFTLSRPVASTYQMLVVVANVTQNPGSAYTVSGNTITFASAPPSGTNNIWVQYTSLLVQVIVPTNSYQVTGPVYTGSAPPLGGATNPIIGSTGTANNYIQTYIYNTSNGNSASADFSAYPNNGNDASGWVDMGITSSTYNNSSYTTTGANEGYLLMSAPSGSGTTGNLVIATDSTGTSNAIQFYVGGFGQAKSAYKFAIESTGAHGQVVSGTSQATTSGTTASFTGIPSWAKRVTLMMNGVITNGTSPILLQVGSGSTTSSGYSSYGIAAYASGNSSTTSTAGFLLNSTANQAPTTAYYGNIQLALLTSNTWVCNYSLGINAGGATASGGGGSIALSGALDRVILTTVTGTQTFTAGSINIQYEG